MGNKVFNLVELKDVQGRPFRAAEKDSDGNVIRDPVKDAEGNPITQIPRDKKGDAIPNCHPEPVYKLRTKALGKDALPELLKAFYLNIPPDKLTRQDTIYGTRMFQSIAAATDGVLTLDDDVHDWIKKKLQTGEKAEENIGLRIFGIDLWCVEQALETFERPHTGKNAAETK